MHMTLLGRSDLTTRSESLVLARRLSDVGHTVSIVCGDGRREVPGADVVGLVRRRPSGMGKIGRMARTVQPSSYVKASLDRRLVQEARATDADIFYPAGPTDVELCRASAAATGALVATQPHWSTAGPNDLAWHAHDEPRWTTSPAGPGLPFPSDHENVPQVSKVAVAYRRTGSNPGRYLEAALGRLGVEVIALDEIDWGAAAEADAVIVVESPLPQLRHRGENPGIPVLYWVHHGEHHLEANLRLARHYQADGVLMAHSLHLAHRFPVPVHRFPFGIAPELGTEWIPFDQRTFDAALIGSGTESVGGRYRRRAGLVAAARATFGHDRVRAGTGLTPAEVVDVYRHSRIVLNDGGDRHLPITMRVFESTGAGSLLLTDPAPGLDSLYTRGEHYLEIEGDVESQLAALAADPASEVAARDAHQHGLTHHTYDQRARRLLTIAAMTQRRAHPPRERSQLDRVFDDDPDVETIAGLPDDSGVHDHVIDDRPIETIPDGGVDAVFASRPGQLDAARRAARLFVYGPAATIPDGDPTIDAAIRRLDVRAAPRPGYAFGGVSYRVAS